MKHYTYAWLREDGSPYYIGKGSLDRAWKDHHRWVNGKLRVWQRPPERVIILKEFEFEFDAYRHEVEMISYYGRKADGGILININRGGEGGSAPGHCKGHSNHTEEQLLKAREHALRLNANQSGASNRNAGTYEITFDDGRVVVIKSLTTWCKENGYGPQSARNVMNGKFRRHKNIISVKRVG